jgi:glycerophosphoryl diester phosphodiesterase
MPALKRIGHKGADLIAPGNTLASFDAALAAGVDMVEFDVLPENPTGRGASCWPTTSPPRRGGAVTLEEGLAHFAQDAWEGIELDVDLKTTATSAASSTRCASTGWPSARSSRPWRRRACASSARRRRTSAWAGRSPSCAATTWPTPSRGAGAARRPVRAHGAARRAAPRHPRGPRRRDHVALGPRDPAPGADDRAAGGELYVWTVDDPTRIAKLDAIGVTGVITNDPRLFATA